MTLSLPEPIANYFAAEMAGDSSALARCFTADGVVRDEGGTFTGIAAIQQWNTQAKAEISLHGGAAQRGRSGR